MRIGDNVWVVTGAGGGIGRELALQLLQRGARVAAVDVSPDGLAGTVGLAAAGDRLSSHVVDITDRDAVRALARPFLLHTGASTRWSTTPASSSRSCPSPTSTRRPCSACSTSTSWARST